MYPTQLHSYLLWRSTVEPDPDSLASRRYTATVSLLPAFMVGIFVFGWYAGLVVVSTIAAALITDWVTHRYVYKDSPGTRDGTWLLTGLLIGLMVPPNIPLALPVIGAILAVFVGKHYLSVDGMPLLQPAAVGLIILHLIGCAFYFSNNNPMVAVKNGEPHWPVLARGIETSSEDARNSRRLLRDFFGGDVRKSVTRAEWREKTYAGQLPTIDNDETAAAVHGPRPINLVKEFPGHPASRPLAEGNTSGSEPYDWIQMLLGYVPGTVGGSSAMAIGFGVLLLIFTGAVHWATPVFAMATMFASLHFLSWMYGGSSDAKVIADNIPIHLMTGSTLIGIFYLAADPTTAPRSFLGKVYAGVAVGLIEVFLRTFLPLAEGIALSVILVQGLSFVIDQWLAPPAEERNIPGVGLSTTSLGRL